MCPYLALWMLPVALGPALAIPLAALTGQRRAGLALRGLGLLRIPEEMNPFAVLARANVLSRATEAERDIDPVARMLEDATLLAAHRRMPPPRRPGIDLLDVALLVGRAKLDEAVTLQAAWAVLMRAEQTAVLSDDAALTRLADLRSVCPGVGAISRNHAGYPDDSRPRKMPRKPQHPNEPPPEIGDSTLGSLGQLTIFRDPDQIS